MPPLPVICLAGPTGAGKTALALNIAEILGCEIVNADSRQVYKDFPIVTAQPDEQEKSRAPHHLYSFLMTDKKLDAAGWAKIAYEKSKEIHSRGRLPLITGGSGFYFQALLSSLAAIPPVSAEISAHYAKQIQSSGSPAAYEELKKIDPDYALKIHPNDKQRIQRALEVYAGTGKTFSWWHKKARPEPLCSGPLFMLDCPLSELEPVLKARIKAMQEKGALKEIISAWKNCPDSSSPGWSGIGCRETLEYLMGRLDKKNWEKEWLANTRAYAKRQLTWFRGRKETIAIRQGDIKAILSHPSVLQMT